MCFSKFEKCDYDLGPLWEPGIYCHDGDSNKHLTNIKKYYGENHFNVATSGATTKTIIARLDAVKARAPEKYSVQVGGNNWIVVLDTIESYLADMKYIIESMSEIMPRDNITICNLPYVDPIIKHPILKLNANKMFTVVNIHLLGLCNELGVRYCDIFNTLKSVFKYNRWCDGIHYGSYGRGDVAAIEKIVMGL